MVLSVVGAKLNAGNYNFYYLFLAILAFEGLHNILYITS
jgi:hypothetical protein